MRSSASSDGPGFCCPLFFTRHRENSLIQSVASLPISALLFAIVYAQEALVDTVVRLVDGRLWGAFVLVSVCVVLFQNLLCILLKVVPCNAMDFFVDERCGRGTACRPTEFFSHAFSHPPNHSLTSFTRSKAHWLSYSISYVCRNVCWWIFKPSIVLPRLGIFAKRLRLCHHDSKCRSVLCVAGFWFIYGVSSMDTPISMGVVKLRRSSINRKAVYKSRTWLKAALE